MSNIKRVHYGKGSTDYVDVVSLADELKYVELMKLYKAFDTLEDLEKVLTAEAKEAIRLIN